MLRAWIKATHSIKFGAGIYARDEDDDPNAIRIREPHALQTMRGPNEGTAISA
jgi:hypothetical protein